jgi:UDP-N-acetylmuramoylalanine--D-glutamate ligase
MMLAKSEVDEMKQAIDWSGKKVLVIGIARQGIALARYLAQHGARIIVNDRRQIDQLVDAQGALRDEPIQWIVGGHPLSVLDGVDLVCISGGVPSDLPIVAEASKRGIPISNDSQIFLEVCPCKVVGITGSAGKTTTITLFGLIAQAAVDELENASQERGENSSGLSYIDYDSKVWVGGNIGSPLISVVDQMQPDDLAVMELSSFQLEMMDRSPDVAVVLNITPNHLDRHKTMENYIAAKSRIIEFQSSQDAAVLNLDDQVVSNLKDDINGRLVAFSKQKIAENIPCVSFDPDFNSVQITSPKEQGEKQIIVINHNDIPLRGEHNLMNVIAACATALACGISPTAMRSGVKKFSGIPHRLEFVRCWGGGDWYNDSIATAPERAIAAIHSFSEPLILLAGGRDKDLPWDGFASLVCERVKHLILFGEAVGVISAALNKYEKKSDITVTVCSGLLEGVKAAATKVAEGEVVLLSPGGTSFDEFIDFEARGEAFKKWVMELV